MLKGRRSLTWAEEQYLCSLALSHPELYLDELQEKLIADGRTPVSIATISKCLKRNSLSLRQLTRVARQRSEIEISNFYQRIEGLDMEQFVFVDETAKDASSARRRRGWVVKGSDATVIERLVRHEDDRYTLIAALNLDGFIPEACLRIDRQVENVDMEVFKFYLNNYLVPCLGNFWNGEKNSVLVIDNAPLHPQDYIRERVEAAGAIVIFTARYAPHINPIEYAFRIFKSSLRRLGRAYRGEELYWIALCTVQREKLVKIFKHCFPDHFDQRLLRYEQSVRMGIKVGAALDVCSRLD